MKTKLSLLLLTIMALLSFSSPAQAHWGDWHQSSCRGDVWYNQTTENRVDYWTAASGYTKVEDHRFSANGNGSYDVYTATGWECGFMGAPTTREQDTWNCYGQTNTCGWHRWQGFENGYMIYATEGRNAYKTYAIYTG